MKVLPKTAFKDLAAIRYFSLLSGVEVHFGDMHYLQQLKMGIKKVLGLNPPDKRIPCTFELLRDVRKVFDLDNYDMLVIFTAMVCATCGLLRTGEFAAANKNVRYRWSADDAAPLQEASQKALWISNLRPICGKDGSISYFKLLLRATKTDIFRQDVEIVLGKGQGEICPVYLLSKMLSMRQTLAKTDPKFKVQYFRPLFMLRNGSILSKYDVSKVVKVVAEKLGIEQSKFKGYSFRIGGATSYARRGYPDYLIKILGRWRSDAYKSYIRYDDEHLAHLTSEMMKRPVTDACRVFLYQDQAVNDYNIAS